MGLSSDVGFPEAFGRLVRQIYTTASNETVDYILSHYDYEDNPARLAWDWTTDVIFACNVAAAYEGISSRYILSVPPYSMART